MGLSYLKMKITIRGNTKIFDLKKEFNTNYPFLKIDFFPHRSGTATTLTLKSHLQNFGDCKIGQSNEEIIIHKDVTVKELNQAFAEIYGLESKIYRKCGILWLETSLTEDWTLEYQNLEGKFLSNG